MIPRAVVLALGNKVVLYCVALCATAGYVTPAGDVLWSCCRHSTMLESGLWR